MDVWFHHAARVEFKKLPLTEKAAMREAIRKLEMLGDQLAHPHSSHVQGADRLRELRPRAGSSSHRALYRRIGRRMWIGVFGPEARHDPRGFERAVRLAVERLAEIEKRSDAQ